MITLRGLFVLAAALPLAVAQSKPIAQITKTASGVYQLLVDGKPFIILGGQVNNPSAFPDRMRRAWPEFKALHANTIEFPVYWDSIEPVEGKFDFSGFDEIVRGLRQQNLRAILLWFGTWKNGAMDYTPAWVKSNPTRFPRVIDSGGKPIRVLSPHGQATLEADRTAYTTLLRHVKEIDEADRTVIMMQVENESGILGSVRDYSPEATRLFNGPVPAQFVTALKKNPGTWTEVFGPRMAEEAFEVYYLSTYIDAVAKAGKAVYPLLTYCNVWMGGDNTNDNFDVWDRPGEGYPSGGPVTHVIDLWKASAPDIDIIGPDIYHQSPIIYRRILASYHRPDNPLMVVETGGGMNFARYMFYALGDYNAIGFTPYGVDTGATEGISPRFAAMAANFGVIGSAVSDDFAAPGCREAESRRGGGLHPQPHADVRQLRHVRALPPGGEGLGAGADGDGTAGAFGPRPGRTIGAGRIPHHGFRRRRCNSGRPGVPITPERNSWKWKRAYTKTASGSARRSATAISAIAASCCRAGERWCGRRR